MHVCTSRHRIWVSVAACTSSSCLMQMYCYHYPAAVGQYVLFSCVWPRRKCTQAPAADSVHAPYRVHARSVCIVESTSYDLTKYASGTRHKGPVAFARVSNHSCHQHSENYSIYAANGFNCTQWIIAEAFVQLFPSHHLHQVHEEN